MAQERAQGGLIRGRQLDLAFHVVQAYMRQGLRASALPRSRGHAQGLRARRGRGAVHVPPSRRRGLSLPRLLNVGVSFEEWGGQGAAGRGGARTGLAEGVGQLQGSCETSLLVCLAGDKEEGPRAAGQGRDVLVRVLNFLLAYLMRGERQAIGGRARQPGGRAGPNRAHQGQGRRVRAARGAGALAWRARHAARTRTGPAACRSVCGRSPTVC